MLYDDKAGQNRSNLDTKEEEHGSETESRMRTDQDGSGVMIVDRRVNGLTVKRVQVVD